VKVELERGGRRMTVAAPLGSVEDKDDFGQPYRKGLLGVTGSDRQLSRPAPWALIPDAAAYTFALTRSTIDGVGQIITGRRSAEELGGPIKMAQIAGQQASLGGFQFVQLLALFSINLGFINLLPVPMLDGGHLALYTIEAVRRRPVGERAQEWAFRGGLALLLALLLFTTLNDIASIGLVDRIGRLIG
jgi:regulator of sigma E protease